MKYHSLLRQTPLGGHALDIHEAGSNPAGGITLELGDFW